MQLSHFITWRILATALEHVLQGNCLTIGESERRLEERVSDMKKREGMWGIDSIYVLNKCDICLSLQRY